MDFPRHHDWITAPAWGRLAIDLVGGGYGDMANDWGTHGRAINEHVDRWYGVERGSVTLVISGVTTVIPCGELVLIPGGQAMRVSGTPDLRLGWIHLRIETAPGISLLARSPRPRRCQLAQADLRGWPAVLAAVGHGRASARALAGIAGLLGVLDAVIEEDWSQLLPPLASDRRFRPVLEAMTAAPSRPWRMAQLAAMVGLHPTTFANRFHAAYGLGPRDHLIDLRLALAREHLRAGVPVGTVAETCGYHDPAYFSRLFSRRVGMPPSAYAALHTQYPDR